MKGHNEAMRINWRLPIVIAAGTVIAGLAIDVSSAFDLGGTLYLFVVAPVVGLALLLFALLKRKFVHLAVAVTYCVATFFLFEHFYDLRTAGRWLLWSRGLKAEVLALPQTHEPELKHIEWDGWGFPGAGETEVYVVFDPNDSLLPAANLKTTGKIAGIPCGVSRIRRLEHHWYSVVMYTDTTWASCG